MDIITKFSSEAFRFYFMRECPFPGDGEFGWERFSNLYNAELANNLGNLYSRVVTLITKNYGGCLEGTVGKKPEAVQTDLSATVKQAQAHIRRASTTWPWKKSGAGARSGQSIRGQERAMEAGEDRQRCGQGRAVCAGGVAAHRDDLLKPFLPRSTETIYRSFNFPQPWEAVRYEDAWQGARADRGFAICRGASKGER